ncbi:SH3 domain-containing protein [Vibrio cholerae]
MSKDNKDDYSLEKLTLNERTALLLDYWKQTSNVQQHFNDVSMKLRNFAVVVFSGFLTGVGLAIHNNISINLLGIHISAGVLFALAGMIATQLIHFMDTYWYHVFLKGAVHTSSSVELEIKKILGVTELSEGISSSSQAVCVASLFGKLHLPIGWHCWLKYLCMRSVEVDSTKRHKIFYRWLLAIFIITGIGSIFTHSGEKKLTQNSDNTSSVTLVYTMDKPVVEKSTNTLETDKTKIGFIISGSNVRVRDLPSFNSEIIHLLPVGKKVTVLESGEKTSWVKVQSVLENSETIDGWVHRDYIAELK